MLFGSVPLAALEGAQAEPAAKGEPASAKQAAAPTCDRAAFKMVIDVGHTEEVPGAKSARGVYEYEFNLKLATVIVEQLRAAGFTQTMLLVTHGKTYAGLAERVGRANGSHADLFLSIHHDSVPDKFLQKWEFEGAEMDYSDRFKGHSIFISKDNADPKTSLQFAHLLGKQMKAHDLQYTPHYTEKFMGHRQRVLVDKEAGVYRYDQLIVLKDTRMPAVLLEAGSIINRDEELAVQSPERQGQVAAAVVEAADAFCAQRQAPKVASKSTQVASKPAGTKSAAKSESKSAMKPASAFSLPFLSKRQ
jgi:N-acetylmuramoyl-L-alanine amidase